MAFSQSELALIEASPILQEIAPERLAEALAKRPDDQLELAPNTTFIKARQIRPGLYLIAKGTIELFVTDSGGKESVIDFAKAGGTLAEETLFNDRPLQYSARSLTPAAVLCLPTELVFEWTAGYPAFARRLMSLVSERIDFLNKDVFTLRTKRATSRLVCYILCHFNKAPMTADGSYRLQIEIPHNRLASRLGLSASQVSRSFRELQERGLMVQQAHGYFIPDVAALSKYVCPAGCDF
jgi:CRP-like cAMP-binding protein